MKSINGLMLKQMIISGANNLFNCYPEIDALNVFPVPDGDTGTNMNLTISSGAKEIANKNDDSVSDIAKAFSRGLLMGARGNSGVILSQIFRGFSKSLDGKSVINALDLADALVMGKEVAYKAVMRPVEGTILTVIREASEALYNQVNKDMSIEQCFIILLDEARTSLQRTPELLPVLKEVGVVDSGGAGLVKILEGFQKALQGNVVEKSMAEVTDINQVDESDEEAEYCIEFTLKLAKDPVKSSKKVFVERRFNSVLNSHCSKVELMVEDNLVKAHLHTISPGKSISFVHQFGEFMTIKIENIRECHTHTLDLSKKAAVKNEENPLKEYGLIAVAIGKGIENLFKEYRVDVIVSGGQTMNPSTEDFVAAIKKCHAENIFILPNNSNIVMAASQACEVTEKGIIAKVIPSKTIPEGLTAAMMFNPEVDMEENEEEMVAAIKNVKTGQVTFAIKDTSIDGVEVKKNQFIGISGKSIKSCKESKIDAMMDMLDSMIDDMSSIISIYYGEDVTEEEKKSVEEKVNEKYGDLDIDIQQGDQPVYSFIVSVE